MNDDWKDKSILVLGLGDTGLSVVRWLARRGARLRAADTRAAPPSLGALRADHPDVGVATGPFDETLLAGVDTVVASPGVALREPVLRAAAARGIEIVGDVEIFAREVAQRKGAVRVIGITGTNGKSTVTALAGAMGVAAGHRTVVAGNIGLPVLDAIDSPEGAAAELFVLELSSYQLETTSSLGLASAAVLNVTQDHLDRYDSMDAYAHAKERIFKHANVRVVNRDDPVTAAMGTAGAFTFGMGAPMNNSEWGFDRDHSHLMRGHDTLLAVDEMAMKGLHNAANGLAAHALLSAIGADPEPLAQAMREFKGLPHRVEFVAEVAGVRYYDDSKGTNVGATVAALEGLTVPVVLIAGGDGKGQDFSPLVIPVKDKTRAVVLIGRDAAAIEKAIDSKTVRIVRAASMEEAVRLAHELAEPGDAVLLSPACASFDMFRNYGHRGDVFAAAVRALS